MSSDEYRLIPLWRRGGEIAGYAKVDEEDYDWLDHWRWQMNATGYAVRCLYVANATTKYKRLLMHRAVMGFEYGDRRICDHINRDRLDNRRGNLRVVTAQQNAENQSIYSAHSASGYRGVSWCSTERKWRAKVHHKGTRHDLGSYAEVMDAVAAVTRFRAEHMPYSPDAREGVAA